ncbi:unnamed protein product [Microthlaspi erraticum]|uniref:Uncharacterized protein n=1 Tax=Microthlaspi erraticum TaxID=1685480 RepID=A0A6D2HHV3_9BRAS|nr:unnamed protein product [Microthlaspi erraticum]
MQKQIRAKIVQIQFRTKSGPNRSCYQEKLIGDEFGSCKIGEDSVQDSRSILDVMVSDSIYTFEDESPFVEREESHEIYREIYGDPIYDNYEDDVLDIDHVDFVFKQSVFKNVCASAVQKQIRAKIVQIQFRTKSGPNRSCYQEKLIGDEFGSCKIGEDSVCEDSVQDSVCVKPMWKNRLKIRGRIFLGR